MIEIHTSGLWRAEHQGEIYWSEWRCVCEAWLFEVQNRRLPLAVELEIDLTNQGRTIAQLSGDPAYVN